MSESVKIALAALMGFGAGITIVLLCLTIGAWSGNRKSRWIEPSTHDLGILPGGYVIHYSTCWCKRRS